MISVADSNSASIADDSTEDISKHIESVSAAETRVLGFWKRTGMFRKFEFNVRLSLSGMPDS